MGKLTLLFEGALIRLIKRLRDIVNQLVDSAKAIGNEELEKKFESCIEKLQRGIVFAASLYVDDMDEDDEEDESEEDDGDVDMGAEANGKSDHADEQNDK